MRELICFSQLNRRGDLYMTNRANFHYGMFYNALKGFLGREPDNKVCMGWDAFYEFWYIPVDAADKKRLQKSVQKIKGWMKTFNLASRSRCNYGVPHPPQRDARRLLQIRIVLQQ
jgi:hypothetical protein